MLWYLPIPWNYRKIKIHAVVLWYLPIPWTYHWFHCLSTLYLSYCEDKLGSPSSISSLGRTGALSGKIFPERFFHRNSNWMDISFCSHPSCSEVIAMEFSTWHDSSAVMPCAKFCSNILPFNGVIQKLIFHRILITTEKSLVKWAPGGLVNKLSQISHQVENLKRVIGADDILRVPLSTTLRSCQSISHNMLSKQVHIIAKGLF